MAKGVRDAIRLNIQALWKNKVNELAGQISRKYEKTSKIWGKPNNRKEELRETESQERFIQDHP